MAKVLGVGGVFFRSPDPARLYAWYGKWLGFQAQPESGFGFNPRELPQNSLTVWSAFPASTEYFAPCQKDFMFNLIVDDVREALAQVKEGGAEIVGDVEDHDYGTFGWFIDPDGNKVELWMPK